jgi:hypothetical protein
MNTASDHPVATLASSPTLVPLPDLLLAAPKPERIAELAPLRTVASPELESLILDRSLYGRISLRPA